MPTTIHWDLNTDSTLGGNNPSDQEIASQKAIKTYTDNGLADKQDVLTAGTNISIVEVPPSEPVDTRSTASIVTVGSARWQGVAYGNGVFVAVGNNGYTAYSSDGATWSTPVQVGTQSWYSITFANGKFVAVGNTGYTTTTTDGVTWTTPVQVSGLTQRLQSVRYGNGVFLAVGLDKKSTTSTDGINWTTPVAISGFTSGAVIFDGTKFISSDKSGSTVTKAYTSTDGSSWTAMSGSANIAQVACIAYGNNTYVMGSETSGDIVYSSDLENWSERVLILNTVESIYWTGTQFIAVGRRAITPTIHKYSTVTSSDGITWDEPVDIGERASSSVITYGFLSITSNGNGKFVAVGDSGATTTFEITPAQDSRTVINGAEIVSVVDSTSTDSESVGAKLFYDTVGNIETLLHNINSGSST